MPSTKTRFESLHAARFQAINDYLLRQLPRSPSWAQLAHDALDAMSEQGQITAFRLIVEVMADFEWRDEFADDRYKSAVIELPPPAPAYDVEDSPVGFVNLLVPSVVLKRRGLHLIQAVTVSDETRADKMVGALFGVSLASRGERWRQLGEPER